jgi:hypothetical protein
MNAAPTVARFWAVWGRAIVPAAGPFEQRGAAEREADALRRREPGSTFRVLRVTAIRSAADRRAEKGES